MFSWFPVVIFRDAEVLIINTAFLARACCLLLDEVPIAAAVATN
jgi:hypothetical protein